MFPKTKRGFLSRINKYESYLKEEKRRFSHVRDSGGIRYIIGHLYLMANDIPGALKHFQWFQRNFPDDIGEPGQFLTWTLVLYKADKIDVAVKKLKQTALNNLYVLPRLLNIKVDYNIKFNSNWEDQEYADYLPEEIFQQWDALAAQWATDLFNSKEFQDMIEEYVKIEKMLETSPGGSKDRKDLVDKAMKMRKGE